ncbi:MAG: hypothetical protein FJ143_04325 [Deltaproteobacteria bacterium]|nr:hypothetical protein [Deltaproteobacteria bacterium]MBM4296945.1 hypothetical protein [Deltaproteobacteria bacterium]
MKPSNAALTHTSVFKEPDALAQFEYGREYDGKPLRSPERRLMFAILIDAVECFQRYLLSHKRREQRLFLQAEAWIFGQEGQWLFSFENICEELRIEPDYLRSGLRRWRAQAQGPRKRAYEHPSMNLPHQRLRNSDIYV